MEEDIVKEIIELNREIKDIIKQHSELNQKIIPRKDFTFDLIRHNIPRSKIDEALLEGLHLEDKHLYPSDPDKKHEGKNYYCIHRYNAYNILVKYLLISYFKEPECIILFHVSPLNFGSEEQRRYAELAKILKNSALKDA